MRPRPEEYLILTKVGKVTRRIVWPCDKPMDLDLPFTWRISKEGNHIRFWDEAKPEANGEFKLKDMEDGVSQHIQLPSATRCPRPRPLTVTLKKLKPPRPVYTNNPSLDGLHTRAPRQLCAFYGQRYFLIRYRPVGVSYQVNLGGLKVFRYVKSPMGYTIAADTATLKLNIGGKKSMLYPGTAIEMKELDFFRCTVVQGIHWWRFRMVPTPDQQAPLETDETDEDIRESMRLQYSAVAFLSLCGALIFSVYMLGKMLPPTPKIMQAEVMLKQPKIFPQFEELKKPDPPKPPPEPPKVAVVEPPPPPKPPEPPVKAEKPKPKKPPQKVAKKPVKQPKVQRVAKAKPAPPPPAPVVTPPPPAPPKDPGPTAEQLAAIQKAKEQQAEQQQALKSLAFLSNSKNAPSVQPTNYNAKTGKFANSAAVGGMTSKSNVLDKMVKGTPGDGSIKTKSGRSIASNINFGDRKNLNDVQGKVSLGELYSKNGDPGEALGGGKGFEMSGPGSLTEGQIEKALAKFLSRFQYCYEKSLLSDSSLGGNLVVQWTIAVSGRAEDARVVKSQLNNEDLHKCVIKVLKDVPFPKPKGGSVTVKKTFSFSSSAI